MYCVNEECTNFSVYDNDRVVKHGRNRLTGAQKYWCKLCDKQFYEFNRIRIRVKRIKRHKGYYITHKPDSKNKLFYYGYEHRNKAEIVLGKKIDSKHPIHHIDGNPSNNNNDNLIICEDSKYHHMLHQRANALSACGDVNKRYCKYCDTWKDEHAFYVRGNGYRISKCKECGLRDWRHKCRDTVCHEKEHGRA